MSSIKVRLRINVLSIFILILALASSTEAQNKKPKFTDIKVGGYFRSFVTYRNIQKNYITGGPLTPKTIMINGLYPDNPLGNGMVTGYREPLIMLLLTGKPTANTSFEVDFVIDNQMTGQIFNSDPNAPGAIGFPKRIQSYRWLNLGGSILTDVGKFDFKTGGVLYFSMSPATLWNYEYRDDMFERYPWEWQTVSFRRYKGFYEDKNIARDSRWGSGSIQGITLVGTQLPFRTGFRFAYGKTNSTGGFQSFQGNNNQDMTALQLNKKFSSHVASVNLYQSRVIRWPQSYSRNFKNVQQEQIVTGELNLNFKGLSLYTEAGTGSISNPVDSVRRWDPLVNVKASAGKEIFPVPVNLQYFHIGSNIVNLNSSIMNTSNRNIQPQFGQQMLYNTTTFEGAVAEFGQLTNNRQGINLSTGIDIKKLKFVLALSSQQELENKFNTITYQHRLNGIVRSQFVFYRNMQGPYGRLLNAWRRSWEKATITDVNPDYKKGFNLIDFSAKYKTSFLGRDIIFSNFINYNSVQDKLSPIALFDDKAFIRSFYEEFMIFYNIQPKLTVVGLVGAERVLGNDRTDLAPNGKPIDQTGLGYGVGLDIDISPTAGLYLRQRWYSFEDKNFTLDEFKGFDTNVELKIFF
ncbi:MAG: hypothetical protein K2X86_15065 [Cytophagaceae bacterium]|nr:hypothetical protein [Cytophagaceae bacterium]